MIALFGGLYSNYLALLAAIEDAQRRGAEDIYCLGDLGAFGPYPDRVFPLIRQHNILCIQGNYDDSIGNDLDDCQCGYTDPRDNYFAQISYDYTLENTSVENRKWLRTLPKQRIVELGPMRLLLCHGSPRRVNEFLWESTTSTHFLQKMIDETEADVILTTHTGIHWHRKLAGGRHYINVGVLGRPENDGTTNVWYTLLSHSEQDGLKVEFIPISYDHHRLASEMEKEKLPKEFIKTITSGWWSTCLEVLPSKERLQGIF